MLSEFVRLRSRAGCVVLTSHSFSPTFPYDLPRLWPYLVSFRGSSPYRSLVCGVRSAMVVPTDTNISTPIQDSRPRPLKVSYFQVPRIPTQRLTPFSFPLYVTDSDVTNESQKLPHPGLHHIDHETKNQCCQRFIFSRNKMHHTSLR